MILLLLLLPPVLLTEFVLSEDFNDKLGAWFVLLGTFLFFILKVVFFESMISLFFFFDWSLQHLLNWICLDLFWY